MSIKGDREERTLLIRQLKYTEDILKRFGMENCKPVSTHIEPGKRFQNSQDDDELNSTMVYQQAIGCLTYLSTATRRPDIAIAVSILSRFMSKPSKEHWSGVKRIFRYLKGTLNFGLKFTVDERNLELIGFSDADWAGDLDTRHSTSGYIFKIRNSTFSWCSKKQITVAKSTPEAEYVALALLPKRPFGYVICYLILDRKSLQQHISLRIIKEQFNLQKPKVSRQNQAY